MDGNNPNWWPDNRGVALLLAVTVISLLVAVTVQFSRDMHHELVGSANLLESRRLGTMAKSGYNISTALLQLDGSENSYDSPHDSWAKLASTNLSEFYGQGKLILQISDLAGKLQINSFVDSNGKSDSQSARASQDIFRRLVQQLSGDELSGDEIDLIVNAIIDWVDADDNETKNIDETESTFYQRLDPPYSCRNGDMEFIEELLLVRGITTDLYYGNEEYAGLKDLLTVHGKDGKININTAPLQIIRAMNSAITIELAEDMIAYRNDEENKTSLEQPNWYQNVLPSDIDLQGSPVTTVSSYFAISATARQNEMEKNLSAVVFRNSKDGNNIAMISRKME